MDENKVIEAEQSEEESRNIKWARFVDTALINFFHANKLEKLTAEDGFGNKVKLSKTRDDDLKVEISSTTIR